MAKNFRTLIKPILDDPRRLENLERYRQEAVAEVLGERLAEIRKAQGVTQQELGRLLGVAQPSLSGTEHRNDMTLSTLSSYIEGLGGRVKIVAEFDDGIEIPLSAAR